MARFGSNLDHVRVAAPCNADWDSMIGNERRRFCGQCQLNVYNLSALTRTEAETFVGQSEGRVCIRYYQRRDGSIITRNCPIGLQALKRRLSRVANAVVSLIVTFLAGFGAYSLADRLSLVSKYRPVSISGALVPVEDRHPAILGQLRAIEQGEMLITGTPVKSPRGALPRQRRKGR